MYEDHIVAIETVAQKIASIVREDIIAGRLKPGTRLAVREFSEKYHVSAMPVREAFYALAGENLLTIEAYKGATVLELDVEYMRDAYALLSSLEDLLIVRVMEKGIPEEVFQRLEELNNEYEQQTKADAMRVNANIEFHKTLFSVCKDSLIYKLYEQTIVLAQTWRRIHPVSDERKHVAYLEHLEIIRALRSGNVEEAVAVTRKHNSASTAVMKYDQT